MSGLHAVKNVSTDLGMVNLHLMPTKHETGGPLGHVVVLTYQIEVGTLCSAHVQFDTSVEPAQLQELMKNADSEWVESTIAQFQESIDQLKEEEPIDVVERFIH